MDEAKQSSPVQVGFSIVIHVRDSRQSRNAHNENSLESEASRDALLLTEHCIKYNSR